MKSHFKKQDDYTQLCIKALTGNLSSADRKDFDAWLNTSLENRNVFNEIKRVWQLSESPEIPALRPVKSGWSLLEQSLGLKQSKTRKSYLPDPNELFAFLRRPSFRPAIISFASLALLAVCLWAWLVPISNMRMVEIKTLNKQRTECVLSDGSRIRLNSGSTIRYKKRFSGNVRRVELKGEAFFEVVPDQKPFRVVTDNANTTVLGTRFNVWARNSQTRVIVEQGRVRLGALNSDGKVILNKGQMSVLGMNNIPETPRNVNTDRLLGWREGRLVFDKTPLSEIIAELERTFDITISLVDTETAQKTITADYDKPSIETVLSSLCITLNAQYSSANGIYSILKK